MNKIPRPSYFVQIRPILDRARQRYRRGNRPNLSDPRSHCGLFGRNEWVALFHLGRLPLTRRDLDYIAGKPTRRQQIAAVVRDVLAADLPEAIDYLEGGRS